MKNIAKLMGASWLDVYSSVGLRKGRKRGGERL